MKAQIKKAFKELENMGAPVFIHSDAQDCFDISAERENSYEWVDYYGEYRGGYSFVDERIEAVLGKHGLFAEWMNPAHLRVYED